MNDDAGVAIADALRLAAPSAALYHHPSMTHLDRLSLVVALVLGACEVAPIELLSEPPSAPGDDDAVTTEPEDGDTSTPIFPTPRRYQIELTWRRAVEPEPGKGTGGLDDIGLGAPSGADLDLHFLHPFAVGRDLDGDGVPDGWFDIPFDVHWNNALPSWGAAGDNDDGRLDLDDRTGPGPEVVTLDLCEREGYRIGVHHFSDRIGTLMVARLAVYVDDVQTFMAEASLLQHDLWEVGVMRCDGYVEPLGGRVLSGVAVVNPQW